MAITDLDRAYAALSGKQALYQTLWDYYHGDQPVVYTSKRLDEIFAGLDAKFTENWSAVVVDAMHERVELKVPRVASPTAQAALDSMWKDQELDNESDDAHLAAFVCGEAFIIVWRDGDGPAQIYFNDPRMCHVFYDAENPRSVAWAAKWWDTGDGKRRMTLYYPDRLEYYISKGKATNLASGKSFKPLGDDYIVQNPFGAVPVFHLRTGRIPLSEMKNAIAPQNGINKLLIDMMVAAEYGAFKQKWIISHADPTGKVKDAPNEVWFVPGGDGEGQATQIGEFSSTDLGNYLKAIDSLAGHLGAITRTPKHYFFQQGGEVSGEALIALEAPLNKKAGRRIERFAPVWGRAVAFALTISGYQTLPADVTVEFEPPETVQPRTRAEVRQLDVASGIPLTTVLKREGWSEGEVDKMLEDKQAEEEAKTDLGSLILQQFEQGGGVG